mgnify:CR=1 FL=1
MKKKWRSISTRENTKLVIILWLGFMVSMPARSMDGFNSRADLLIRHVADHYPAFNEGQRPPGYDGSLSDFGKFNYPKILATFSIYGDTVENWNRQLEIYAQKPTFHFNLLGLTRILYTFPNAPAIQKHEKDFLKMLW